MSITILPDDYLKTGDPRHTWQPECAPTWLNRHGLPTPEGPAEDRNRHHDVWCEWQRHVDTGRIGGNCE